MGLAARKKKSIYARCLLTSEETLLKISSSELNTSVPMFVWTDGVTSQSLSFFNALLMTYCIFFHKLSKAVKIWIFKAFNFTISYLYTHLSFPQSSIYCFHAIWMRHLAFLLDPPSSFESKSYFWQNMKFLFVLAVFLYFLDNPSDTHTLVSKMLVLILDHWNVLWVSWCELATSSKPFNFLFSLPFSL